MGQRKFSKKPKNHPRVNSAIAAWRNEAAEKTDILGWYTGVPAQKGQIEPEQDQDDL